MSVTRRTVAECRSLLAGATDDEALRLVRRFLRDPRAGVRAAARTAARRVERARAEEARLAAMHRMQEDLHDRGCTVVAGVDEVGRGALAGPVSAGAAVLDAACSIPGLDDSKRLTPARREEIAARLRRDALCFAVAHVSPRDIDRVGIARATRRAMRDALRRLSLSVDHVLVDGRPVDLGLPSTPVIGGDAICAAIAAAAVLAKVERDALMRRLDDTHPGYDLAANKGYGTPEHLSAIRRFGPSPVHRLTFAPCADDPRLF